MTLAVGLGLRSPWISPVRAQRPPEPCPRPAIAGTVNEPDDLRSSDGELRIDLSIRNQLQNDGSVRYCYATADGRQSPNLRLHPGDLLILNLINELTDPAAGTSAPHSHAHADSKTGDDPCTRGWMTAISTNLHFHGLTIPAACRQDDVLGDQRSLRVVQIRCGLPPLAPHPALDRGPAVRPPAASDSVRM